MAELRWNQNDFSAGQIDPKAQARDDLVKFFKGAREISNNVVLPQGGVQRRWGTDYVDTLSSTNPNNVQLWTLTYDDSAVYLLAWEAGSVKIYLEDILVATVTAGYPYMAEDIAQLYFCQLVNRLVIAHPNYNPYILTRSANADNAITAINTPNKTITLTNALTNGAIYPVIFATAGTLPTTSPQIRTFRTYFLKMTSTTTAQIFSTSQDASDAINPYDITALGSSSVAQIQNTWTIALINIINYPGYDFTFGENTRTVQFTGNNILGPTFLINPGDTVIIDSSVANTITSDFIGGYLVATTATMVFKITSIVSTTRAHGVVMVVDPPNTYLTYTFPAGSTTLYRPAWSNTLGWPRACTVFQGRLYFAGTDSINNGLWGSQVNDYFNFDDSDIDYEDAAISFYASSGTSNYIVALTAGRTLLVHTNTATFSTATGNIEAPLTPSNFNLIEQNKDGVSNVQPVFIDNQVIYVDKSGNNAKNLVFDILQGLYALNNISYLSSNTINQPVDMAAFTAPNFTDGAYVIFVNQDGTLGIFQTLIQENIAAWSIADTVNATGSNNTQTPAYYRHIASSLNDCWFLVERTINGNTRLMIERADFDIYTDCTKTYTNWGSATVTGLSYLEGQYVYATADGYLQPPQVVAGGQIVLSEPADEIAIGINYESNLTPLQIGGIPNTPANQYKPMHIRVLYIRYYQTIGGTIGGSNIQTIPLQDVILDQEPVPMDGIKELKLMGGWNTIDYRINITQSLPLPMTILGLGYVLEIP